LAVILKNVLQYNTTMVWWESVLSVFLFSSTYRILLLFKVDPSTKSRSLVQLWSPLVKMGKKGNSHVLTVHDVREIFFISKYQGGGDWLKKVLILHLYLIALRNQYKQF